MRRRRWELIAESLVEWLIRLCGVSAILFVFGIFFFVFREGAPVVVERAFQPRASSCSAPSGIRPRRATSATACWR